MEEEDFSKLAVEDRCAHKSWKARVSGYEEAVKLFNQWDGDDANWKKVKIIVHIKNCIFDFFFQKQPPKESQFIFLRQNLGKWNFFQFYFTRIFHIVY